MSGGYGEDELARAGAYRVYQDPADLLTHLNEVGIRNIDYRSLRPPHHPAHLAGELARRALCPRTPPYRNTFTLIFL
jgi:hypothetical protein